MAFNTFCDNTQKVVLTAAPSYADPNTGQPVAAEVDGPLRVSVLEGDGTFLMTGPLTFEAISGTAVGTPEAPANTVYQVQADADLAPDAEGLITETVVLSVVAAPPPPTPQASAFGFTASAPVPK